MAASVSEDSCSAIACFARTFSATPDLQEKTRRGAPLPFGTHIPFGMILLVIFRDGPHISRLHDSREWCNRVMLNYRQRISRIIDYAFLDYTIHVNRVIEKCSIIDNSCSGMVCTIIDHAFHVFPRAPVQGWGEPRCRFICFHVLFDDNALIFATRIHFCVCVGGATRGHTRWSCVPGCGDVT